MPDLDPQELIDEAAANEGGGDDPGQEQTPGTDTPPEGEPGGGGADTDAIPDSDGDKPEPPVQPPAQAKPDKPEVKAPEIDLDQYKLEDIPDDYEPKNWKEVLQLAEDRAYKRIKGEDAQRTKAEQDDTALRTAALQEIQAGYDAEIDDLTKDGRLPAGDDGLKRQEQVWTFMNEENSRREKAGSQFFINSFEDALNLLEVREAKAEAAKKEAEEAELRKKRGAAIGGTSGAKVPSTSASGLRKGMTMDQVMEQEGY